MSTWRLVREDDTQVVSTHYLDVLGIKIGYDALGADANKTAAVREENDAFTVSTICDFIEPMQYERVEATDYSVSFGVTSRLDSYLYRPTSLWHFSGQCGSTLTAMLNEHVFFLMQILTVAFGEHALALENAPIRLDSPAAAVREENDAFTVSTICDFIEPMQYERVEATDYSVSFGVTSRLDSYLYRPTSLWHFSGQCGSTLTAMPNEHVFFLVQRSKKAATTPIAEPSTLPPVADTSLPMGLALESEPALPGDLPGEERDKDEAVQTDITMADIQAMQAEHGSLACNLYTVEQQNQHLNTASQALDTDNEMMASELCFLAAQKAQLEVTDA
ncbi:hypothetical protein MRX96_025704 [Rhipicephalus microplus]